MMDSRIFLGVALIIFFFAFEAVMNVVLVAFLASLFALLIVLTARKLAERIGLPERLWAIALLAAAAATRAVRGRACLLVRRRGHTGCRSLFCSFQRGSLVNR